MGIKYPIEYQVEPDTIETGTHWITLKLKNIGTEPLTLLNVNLNSLDSYNLDVLGTGKFISDLKPNEEEIVPFQVYANRTTSAYVTLSGRKGGKYYSWECSTFNINVGAPKADLENLYVLSHPYTAIGKTLEVEATLRGKTESGDLELEFWVDKPNKEFEKIANIDTKKLSSGETARYKAEFKPDEEGLYKAYAYLYDGADIIGRKSDSVLVSR